MPTRIFMHQRVIPGITEAVQLLGVARLRQDRIRLGKAPQRRVVPAGAVEVQTQPRLPTLPGVAVGRRRGA